MKNRTFINRKNRGEGKRKIKCPSKYLIIAGMALLLSICAAAAVCLPDGASGKHTVYSANVAAPQLSQTDIIATEPGDGADRLIDIGGKLAGQADSSEPGGVTLLTPDNMFPAQQSNQLLGGDGLQTGAPVSSADADIPMALADEAYLPCSVTIKKLGAVGSAPKINLSVSAISLVSSPDNQVSKSSGFACDKGATESTMYSVSECSAKTLTLTIPSSGEFLSVSGIRVLLNGADVTSGYIGDVSLPITVGVTLNFTSAAVLPSGGELVIEVTYSSWRTVTLSHVDLSAQEGQTGSLGKVTFTASSNTAPINGSTYAAVLEATSASRSDKVKPGAGFTNIQIAGLNKRSAVRVKVEVGGEDVTEQCLDTSPLPIYTSGYIYFKQGIVMPADEDVAITVYYDKWNTVTLKHIDLSAADGQPGTRAQVSFQTESAGLGSTNTLILSADSDMASAECKPGAKLNNISVWTPDKRSTVKITVEVGGKDVTGQYIDTSSLPLNSAVQTTFSFKTGAVMPTDEDVVITVYYDEWNTVTLKHIDLGAPEGEAGDLADFRLQAESAGFSGTNVLALLANVDTVSSVCRPGTKLQSLIYSVPTKHAVVGVKVEIGGEDVTESYLSGWQLPTPTSSSIALDTGYVMTIDKDVVITVYYNDWESFVTLTHVDLGAPEGSLGDLGDLTLRAAGAGFGGTNTLTLAAAKETVTSYCTPGETLQSIGYSIPTKHAVVGVKVEIGGEDVTESYLSGWQLPTPTSSSIALNKGLVMANGSEVVITVYYNDWESFVTLTHVDLGAPEGSLGDLGDLTLRAAGAGLGGTNTLMLKAANETATSYCTPGETLQSIGYSIPTKHAVVGVKVEIGGEDVTESYLGSWQLPTPTSSSIALNKGLVMANGSEVVITVYYNDWESFVTLTHVDLGAPEDSLGDLANLTLSVAGAGLGGTNTLMLPAANETTTSYCTPGETLQSLIYSVPSRHAIVDIKVERDGEDVTGEYLDLSKFPATSDGAIGFKPGSVMTIGSKVAITVYYSDWDSLITLKHVELSAPTGTSGDRADIMLQTAGSGINGFTNTLTLPAASDSVTAYCTPGKVLQSLHLNTPSKHAIVNIKVERDGVDVTEDYFDLSQLPVTTRNTIGFKPGSVMIAESKLTITVYYNNWDSLITLKHVDLGAPEGTSGDLADLMLQTADGGINGLTNILTLSETSDSVTAYCTPGKTLQTLHFNVPTKHAVMDIKVEKGGVDVTGDYFDLSQLPATKKGTIGFKSGSVMAADGDIVVTVYYGDWDTTVTLKRVDLGAAEGSAGTFADVVLQTAGTGLDGTNTLMLTAANESISSYCKPGEKLQSLILKVPSKRAIVGITVEIDGVDVTESYIDLSQLPVISTTNTSFGFKSAAVMNQGSEAVITVYYNDWHTVTLNHIDRSAAEGSVGQRAQVTLKSNGTGMNNSSSLTLTAGSDTVSSIVKPGEKFKDLAINVPTQRSIVGVTVKIGGVDVTEQYIDTSSLPQTINTTLNFKADAVMPADKDVVITVYYDDWETVTLNQVDLSAPDELTGRRSAVTLKSNGTGMNNSSSLSLTASVDSVSAVVRPGEKFTELTVNLTPSLQRSFVKVKVEVGGKDVTEQYIDTSPLPSANTITLKFTAAAVMTAQDNVVITVYYDDWTNVTLKHVDLSAPEGEPGNLAQVQVYTNQTNVINGSSGSLLLAATADSISAVAKPGESFKYVRVNAPAQRSVVGVTVEIGDEDVTEQYIDTSLLPVNSGYRDLQFKAGAVMPADEDIVITVYYNGWANLILSHVDLSAPEGEPGNLAQVQAYTKNSTAVGGNANKLVLAADVDTVSSIVRPGEFFNTLNFDAPLQRSVVGVKIQIGDEDVTEQYIDTSLLPSSAANQILNFKADAVMPADKDILITVYYDDWTSVTLQHVDLAAPEGDAGTRGDVSLYTRYSNMIDGTGNKLALTAEQDSVSAVTRPGAEFSNLYIYPPTMRSVVGVKVEIDGLDVTEQYIDTSGLPSSAATQILSFTQDAVMPADKDIVVTVYYDGWHSVTLQHVDLDAPEGEPGALGEVKLYTETKAVNGTANLITLEAAGDTASAFVKPGGKFSSLSLTTPTMRSLVEVKVEIDGEDVTEQYLDTSLLPSTSGSVSLNFKPGAVMPADKDVVITVYYDGWHSVTLQHVDLSVPEGEPGALGEVKLYTESYAINGKTQILTLEATGDTASAFVKPGGKFSSLSLTTPTMRSLVEVKVEIDGEDVTEQYLDTSLLPSTSGSVSLNFKPGAVMPADKDVVITVYYDGWHSVTLQHVDLSAPEGETGALGDVRLYTESYAVNGKTQILTLEATGDTASAFVKPGGKLSSLTMITPLQRSTVGVTIEIDGEDVTEQYLDTSLLPSTSSSVSLSFKQGTVMPADKDVTVTVFYADWKNVTLKHVDLSAPEGETGSLGEVRLYTGSYAVNGTTNLIRLPADGDTVSAAVKPGGKFSSLNLTAPVRRSIVEVKVEIGDVDVTEQYLDTSSLPNSAANQILNFKPGAVMPADKDVVITVYYNDWSNVILNHVDLSAPESDAGTRGNVNLYTRYSNMIDGTGNKLALTAEKDSVSAATRPGAEFSNLYIYPPTMRSAVGVKIEIDGVDVTEQYLDTSLLPSAASTVLLSFNAEAVMPEDSDLEITVYYADWRNVTLSHVDLSAPEGETGVRGDVRLYTGSNAVNGTSNVIRIAAADDCATAAVKPNSRMTQLYVSVPTGRSVVGVKVEVGGEDVTEQYINTSLLPSAASTVLLSFNAEAVMTDANDVNVTVYYADWRNVTLSHVDLSAPEGETGVRGDVRLYTGSNAVNGTSNVIRIAAADDCATAAVKPNSRMTQLYVSVPTGRSVVGVKVEVGGEDVTEQYINTSLLPSAASTVLLSFNAEAVMTDANDVNVTVYYADWRNVTLSHVDLSAPEGETGVRGDVKLYTGSYAVNGTSNVIRIAAADDCATAAVKPNSRMTQLYVSVPTGRSVVGVKVEVGGEDVTEQYLDTSLLPSAASTVTLPFNAEAVMTDASDVNVTVYYADWRNVTLSHVDLSAPEGETGVRGDVRLYTGSNAVNGTSNVIRIAAADDCATAAVKPNSRMTQLYVSVPTGRSVVSVKVEVGGEDVTEQYINTSLLPSAASTVTLPFNAEAVMTDASDVNVTVYYADWRNVTLSHVDLSAPEGETGVRGDVRLYTGSNAVNGTSNVIRIAAADDCATAAVKPNSRMTQLYVSVPTGRSVVSVKVEVGGEDVTEQYLDTSLLPSAASTVTLPFNAEAIMTDANDVNVTVYYADWRNVTLNHIDLGAKDGSTGVRGQTTLYTNSYAVNGRYNNLVLPATSDSVTAAVKPGEKFRSLYVTVPTMRSVVSVTVEIGGEDVTEQYLGISQLPSTASSLNLWFNDSMVMPTDKDVVITVYYADWNSVTLEQTNLLGGALGNVRIYADGSSLCTSRFSNSFAIGSDTASASCVIRPGSYVTNYIVTPPAGYSIVGAKATVTDETGVTSAWTAEDGKDVLSIDNNGSLVFNKSVPTGDVVLSVEYGTMLYAKANEANAVEIDASVLSDSFTRTAILTAPSKSMTITAKPGWRIVSVKYGTASAAQNTQITADGGVYKIESIASDIYVNVEVEPTGKALTARQDGTGSVSIGYGGSDFVLTGAARVLSSEIKAGTNVAFTLTPGENTVITGVQINGSAIDEYEFAMPDVDAEIVVFTEYVEPKRPYIEAVKTGNGSAFAAYGENTVTLTAQPRVIADDLPAGAYDIVITPEQGSLIMSVSANGTALTPKAGTENTYTVNIASDNVLVTVETKAKPEYKVSARASVKNAAEINGIALPENYVEVASASEGDNVALELAAAPGYEILNVYCGDSETPADKVEFTDGKYEISAIESDMFLIVEAVKQPQITVNRTGSGSVTTNSGSVDVSNTTYTVEYGSSHTFDFVPGEECELESVTVKIGNNAPITVYSSGADDAAAFSYDLNNVSEDCFIDAKFSSVTRRMYVIKQGDGEGSFEFGGVSYTGSFDVPVQTGSAPSITIKAAKGSAVSGVKVGGSAESAVSVEFNAPVLTLDPVTGDVYVVVDFKKQGLSGGGTPATGDNIPMVAINLFTVSVLTGIVALVSAKRRKKSDR